MYTIIHTKNHIPIYALEELEDKVKVSLSNGWVLQGGVSHFITVYKGSECFNFTQAMVKKDD